ncbi:MAG: hypothetical protein ACI3V0_08660 [Faecousia sp.]
MKKWIILALVLVLLLAAGGVVGYNVWYQNSHIFVEDAVYEKDLTFLDLRGTGVSLEHYEAVRQQLESCEIRYDLPFQGSFYADDTTELTITSLTDEEVELLDYLPGLTVVHAEGCRDYEQLRALQERRPDCKVTYTVSLFGREYAQDTKELSFGSETLDMEELSAALVNLRQMKRIHFDQPTVAPQDLVALMETYPDISITWEKDAFGATYSSDVTELDLTGMIFASLEEVEQGTAYFPALEKVILSECGPAQKQWFDNETMAAFREKMRSEYKVVWTVQINNLKVRTDETYFMPAKHHTVVTNFQAQNLKYCEDMICVDLGHMAITDITFVEGMPHLKYFIIVDAPLMYIDSISTCKELIYLEFFWTWLNDFTPLLECTAMQDLNVSRTNGDPMVFKEMTWLKNLWIDGNDLTAEEKVELEAALPNTHIEYCYGVMARNGWRDLQNYFDMRDLLGMPYNTW